MWLEIGLAWSSKIADGGFWIFIIIAIVLVVIAMNMGDGQSDEIKKAAWKWFYAGAASACFAFLLSTIPSVDDLWRVRIGMIKLHLASQENLEKGAEVIERIGHKLECKYIGGKGCEERK